MTLTTVDGLKNKIPTWLGRDDIDASDINDFIALTVSEMASDLNFFLSESVLSVKAIVGQFSVPLPSHFAGASRVYVGGQRYTRDRATSVLDGVNKNTYALIGELIVFYPSTAAGKQIEIHYHGLIRSNGDGTGVSSDNLNELFFRMEEETGITETIADLRGRYEVLTDQLKRPEWGGADFTEGASLSLDEVDHFYNAFTDLVKRFPLVVQCGAMSHAYAFLQDEAREMSWRNKYEIAAEKARSQLIRSEWGRDKIAIKPRGYGHAVPTY